MNYYFFAASLPALTLDGTPLITIEKFRALCAEHMSREDFEALKELDGDLGAESKHAFAAKWRDREKKIRNAAARTRASRLKRDPAPYLKEVAGWDCHIEKAVSDAFSRSNPLEREMALDRTRWAMLDELAGYNAFSGDAVLAYSLKLKIAWRWAAMSPEQGRARIDGIAGNNVEIARERIRSVV